MATAPPLRGTNGSSAARGGRREPASAVRPRPPARCSGWPADWPWIASSTFAAASTARGRVGAGAARSAPTSAATARALGIHRQVRPGLFGNSEAVWPSSPMPRTSTSIGNGNSCRWWSARLGRFLQARRRLVEADEARLRRLATEQVAANQAGVAIGMGLRHPALVGQADGDPRPVQRLLAQGFEEGHRTAPTGHHQQRLALLGQRRAQPAGDLGGQAAACSAALPQTCRPTPAGSFNSEIAIPTPPIAGHQGHRGHRPPTPRRIRRALRSGVPSQRSAGRTTSRRTPPRPCARTGTGCPG